jgi:hypothetical protein
MDSGPGDEMLLLAVAERDVGACRTLYERHAGWLAIRLARRCNDRDLVADAIQPRGRRGGAGPSVFERLLRVAGLPAAEARLVVMAGSGCGGSDGDRFDQSA